MTANLAVKLLTAGRQMTMDLSIAMAAMDRDDVMMNTAWRGDCN